MAVVGRAVGGCASHAVVLAEHFDPAILVAAADAGDEASLSQVIEHRDLFGQADGIPPGEREDPGGEFNALGAGSQIGKKGNRGNRDFQSFGVKVVFGQCQGVKARAVGVFSDAAHLGKHLLHFFVVAPDRPQALAFFVGRRDRRQHEEHELH